ncbi:MFS transporter [Streptomyces jeddahensis]|uniref:2-acyl-glycerophospho-ethanolamine acyltransferase n=1 Tax=Streptomyces jeddahensis TaxID=1716141 RepID=A0A177HLD6_9ACTN|nr:MFS transporter [Streptomyces jeddahensis]OAH11822.1 2-acyl-glycerophospho-ethanolamine acyltransferase [Streptomyces jeddahensis]
MAVVRDLRVLLRFGNFRRLLAVRLLSQGADGVYQVALATYVVFSPEKPASPAAIASAMAVLLLPYSLVGPFAGVLLDRWRRRQVLLYGSLLRAFLATVTAVLMVSSVPEWLFYASALCVTAVNRFVLAGLSAALPRVVDADRLVMANSLSPTAGTLAATAGGGLAFLVRLVVSDSDTAVVLTGAGLYLCAGLASLRLARELLGPDPALVQPRLWAAVAGTARGLAAGIRHLVARPVAVRALAAMTLMRFCYGALTVMVLMLCRYAWSSETSGSDGAGDSVGAQGGLALLGLAVLMSGAGFFAAAVVTPYAAGRLGPGGWIAACAGAAAVLEPALGLPFAPAPMMAAAFVLGLTTQGAKIATDTLVQSSIDDGFRGRIFSVYDVLFNVAFVGAAGVAALMLPPDGRSVPLVITVAVIYAVIAAAMARFERQ